MSFSMHDFMMKGFRDAVGKMPDYKIIMNAVAWYEKNVLTKDDLAVLQVMIDEKNMPAPEYKPEVEDSVEE